MSTDTFEFVCQKCDDNSCLDCAMEELTIRYKGTDKNLVKKTILGKCEENLEGVIEKKDAEIEFYKEKISAFDVKLNEMEKVLMGRIKDAEERMEQQNEKIRELEEKEEKTGNIMYEEKQSTDAENSKPNITFSYIWKVTEFTKLQDAAKSDEDEGEFYTVPFYSSKYGYKMRLIVYPNGDNNNGHLSVYLLMMEGEYDGILKWPIEYEAEMQILDQSNRENFYSERFESEVGFDLCKRTFYRPTNEPSIAWGLTKFISLDQLKRSYLVDDTIFLKLRLTITC